MMRQLRNETVGLASLMVDCESDFSRYKRKREDKYGKG